MVDRTGRLLLALIALSAQRTPPPANPPRQPWERIDEPSFVACGGCHTRVFEEWSESLHARAWTNPNARRASDGFARTECRPCHSPRSVFETGFRSRPAFRSVQPEDGVHCLSCHGLPDGVAAARAIPEAPCRPRLEPRLIAADFCWPCHQPTHGAYDEYRTSDAFALGLRCVDCHMQPRADGSGRSHGPHGGFSPDFVRRALAWSARRVPGAVELVLRNRAGHRFPGEIPSRALVVELRPAAGPPTHLTLRKPFPGEARADDRLLPDEERTLLLELPDPSAGPAQVRLYFRPVPGLPLDAAYLLGEWSG